MGLMRATSISILLSIGISNADALPCREVIKVFYRPEMNVADSGSYSPSAGKPAQLMDYYRANNAPTEIVSFPPLSPADFKVVHDSAYVDGIFNLTEKNGFGNRNPEIADSLRYTSASMLAAAREALKSGIAHSPTSGFHHAHTSCASGFCTFNGLALTAKILLDEGAVRKVAIVDLDMHKGDGTDDILFRKDLEGRVFHFTAGREFYIRDQVPRYFEALESLRNDIERTKPDLILYQAGADPHIKDPLGGMLTTAEMMKRDEMIFKMARDFNIPIVWNLAGGYQIDSDGTLNPVLRLHYNTLLAAQGVYRISEPEALSETP